MMETEGRQVSRRSRRLAALGSFLGLGFGLVLTALLIRVHILERDGGSPAFALIYSAVLLSPFVVSIMALIKGRGTLQLKVWGTSGFVASLLAVVSVSLVALPLLIPALLLIAATAMGDAD